MIRWTEGLLTALKFGAIKMPWQGERHIEPLPLMGYFPSTHELVKIVFDGESRIYETVPSGLPVLDVIALAAACISGQDVHIKKSERHARRVFRILDWDESERVLKVKWNR